VAGSRLAERKAIGGATDAPDFVNRLEDRQQIKIKAAQIEQDAAPELTLVPDPSWLSVLREAELARSLLSEEARDLWIRTWNGPMAVWIATEVRAPKSNIKAIWPLNRNANLSFVAARATKRQAGFSLSRNGYSRNCERWWRTGALGPDGGG
jgi:hypothetical protein